MWVGTVFVISPWPSRSAATSAVAAALIVLLRLMCAVELPVQVRMLPSSGLTTGRVEGTGGTSERL